MEKILSRKYSGKVVVGLCIGLAAAIGVAVYLYMQKPTLQLQGVQVAQGHHHPSHPTQPSQPSSVNPEHVETYVDVTNKPVLLLVWAKWCGHSTAFKPTWDKIRTILNKDGTVEVGEIESDENKAEFGKFVADIGQPNFPGFPHVRFYPNGYGDGKKSIPYHGNRTEDDIIKFAYQSLSK